MKVTAYHRTNGTHSTLWAGSFLSDAPMAESYGSRLVTVTLEVSRPAGDRDVRAAARELGLFKRSLKAYEYLSPGLMDAHVSEADVAAMIDLLKSRGFDCARVTDYDCPKSWVTFAEVKLASAQRPRSAVGSSALVRRPKRKTAEQRRAGQFLELYDIVHFLLTEQRCPVIFEGQLAYVRCPGVSKEAFKLAIDHRVIGNLVAYCKQSTAQKSHQSRRSA